MSMPLVPPINPSSAFAAMKGNHVAVRVPDFEASKRWFVEKLDFRVVHEWSSNDLSHAYVAPATDDAFFVEIIGGGSPIHKPGYAGLEESLHEVGYHHFSLNVDNVEDTVDELRRRGVEMVKEPFDIKAISRRLAFFADPWGNLIELAQILEREAGMQVIRRDAPGGESRQGERDKFVGDVTITDLTAKEPPDGIDILRVFFATGARTHWHRHPRGQVLEVVSGKGRVGSSGKGQGGIRQEGVYEIWPGDHVFTAPNTWHWHGASPESPMTHIAINPVAPTDPDPNKDWAREVTDEEYKTPPSGVSND